MTLDDESFLSAYMDGQLSPDQQQAVESALVADPHLAEVLRDLTDVRDLLAGLSREAPVDVTVPVMSRIRRRLRLRAILAAPYPPTLPRWAQAAPGIGLAAALLIALVMPWFFVQPLQPPHGAGESPGPATADLKPSPTSKMPIPQPNAPKQSEPSSTPDVSGGAPGEIVSGGRQPGDRSHGAGEDRAPTEIEQVRQYLDNPRLRHILMIADLDGTAQQKVASVVEQTTRFNFYQITISRGIVIDPRHPDQATVFALVVSPREYKALRDQLRIALKDQPIEEPPVDPRVVTQLADIADVRACKPAPVGDIMIPREALVAFKHPGVNPEPRDRPTPEQERSAPVPDLDRERPAAAAHPPHLAAEKGDGRSPGVPPGPPEDPDRRLVVLVWVSRPRSG